MDYDSLIRNMSTIIFLIFSFFEKKEGKVSILAASLLPGTFMEFVWYTVKYSHIKLTQHDSVFWEVLYS